MPAGQRRVLNWRHNLDSGAQPELLEQGETREACVEIAMQAAKAIGIRFGSIDVVQVDGARKILEINSGVMMEALSQAASRLVHAAYSAALDKVFCELVVPALSRDPYAAAARLARMVDGFLEQRHRDYGPGVRRDDDRNA